MSSDEDTPKEILCFGFNQDASCLAVGLRTGYRIYTCRPFAQRFSMENGGIGRAEMLFSSSLVALVGSGDRPAFSPRRLRLWNTKKDHTICEVNFLTAVLSVKLNRKRVAVCLKTALHLFDISDMNCLRTLETAPNPDGVMALSPNEDNCHLAFPDGEKKASGSGGSSRGEVILYDALDLKVLNKVVACRSRVVAVSFSPDGKLLATASEQGTVIRIFTVPAAVKTFTLRRGSTTCGIYSMAFNAAATRLAVSSSNRTIHIFDVSPGASAPGGGGGSGGGTAGGDRGRESRRSNRSSRTAGGIAAADVGLSPDGSAEGAGSNRDMRAAWRRSGEDVRGTEGSVSGGGLASGFRSVVGMLPNGVTKRVQDYVDCNRSFASVRLRQSAGRSICALIPAGESGVRVGRSGGPARPGDGGGGNGNENDEEEGEILLVVTNEGILYSYVVDTVRGGECRLEQASSLLMDPNASQEIGSELFGPERRAPPVLAGQG